MYMYSLNLSTTLFDFNRQGFEDFPCHLIWSHGRLCLPTQTAAEFDASSLRHSGLVPVMTASTMPVPHCVVWWYYVHVHVYNIHVHVHVIGHTKLPSSSNPFHPGTMYTYIQTYADIHMYIPQCDLV